MGRKRFGDSDVDGPPTAKKESVNLMEGLKYGNFAVYLINGRNCLKSSGSRCAVRVQERMAPPIGSKKWKMLFPNQLAGTAIADNIKPAKTQASKAAKAKANPVRHCYFIKPNPDANSIKNSNEQIGAEVKRNKFVENKIDSSNVGYKMMKMMGWSGGGLGPHTQGREDPVGCLLKFNRFGLGREVPKWSKKYEIFIGNQIAGTAVANTKKLAKTAAFEAAMADLRKHCYFIKPNPDEDSINISKSNENIVAGVKQSKVEDKEIDIKNVCFKMKTMGWSGDGLGSQIQGREDPVGHLLKVNRSGLGSSTDKTDRLYFEQILQNYLTSDDIRDLHFEATFTKEERALLHEISGEIGLKSTSYGKGEGRRLIIKKTITTEQILQGVLVNQSPNFRNKYSVQVPPSKAKEFPLFTTELELTN